MAKTKGGNRDRLNEGQPDSPTARQPDEVTRQGRTSEPSFNVELANVLRMKHPRWPDRIGAEQTGVLAGYGRLQPDIIVRHPGGLPVAVETEYAPAQTVEAEATDRLGKTLRQDGRAIEQAIAVRLPVHLKTANQSDLPALIVCAELEFCVFSGNPDEPSRWPASGWIEGGIDDLAACIEQAALSEDRVAQGMRVLEDGIGQAATLLREACADAPDTLTTIARELHQEDGEQTSRMSAPTSCRRQAI